MEMNVNGNNPTQKAKDLVREIASKGGDTKKIDTYKELYYLKCSIFDSVIRPDDFEGPYPESWSSTDKKYLETVYKKAEKDVEKNEAKEYCKQLKKGVQKEVINFIKSTAKSNLGLDKKEIDGKYEAQALLDYLYSNKDSLGRDDVTYIKSVLLGANYWESGQNPGTVTNDENDCITNDDEFDCYAINSNGEPILDETDDESS